MPMSQTRCTSTLLRLYTTLFYDWPHEDYPGSSGQEPKGRGELLRTACANHRSRQGVCKARRSRMSIGATLPPRSRSWPGSTGVLREFDFESSHWPPQFHHTGPFHDGAGRIDIDFPLGATLTGEPLIYASMGTLQNGLTDRVSHDYCSEPREAQRASTCAFRLAIRSIRTDRNPFPSNQHRG